MMEAFLLASCRHPCFAGCFPMAKSSLVCAHFQKLLQHFFHIQLMLWNCRMSASKEMQTGTLHQVQLKAVVVFAFSRVFCVLLCSWRSHLLLLGKYNERGLSTVHFLLKVMEILGFKCRSSVDVLSITGELEILKEVHLFSFASHPVLFVSWPRPSRTLYHSSYSVHHSCKAMISFNQVIFLLV